VSAPKANLDRFKRHRTRHRGITYRLKKDASRTYYVYASGRHLAVRGGEKAALAKQAELRGMLSRGERLPSRPLRFAEAAEQWFNSKDKLRGWTKSGYRSALDSVLLPRFGTRKMAEITVDDVLRLIRDLEKQDLSRSTIDNLLKPLAGRSVRLEEAGVNCKVARLLKAEALDSESNRASRFAHACLMNRIRSGTQPKPALPGGFGVSGLGRAPATTMRRAADPA